MIQNNKRSYFLLIIIILSAKLTSAQQLKIGEKIPEVVIKKVINSSFTTLNLRDYSGKLIILDFWQTGCPACIEAFPKMNELQSTFKDKIQIILVTHESADSIIHFFSKRKQIKLPQVPFVTGDSILSVLFRPKGFPWHVWIDSNQTVYHITNGYNATIENIKKYFSGQLLYFKELGNSSIAATPVNPWADDKLEYYSKILHYDQLNDQNTIGTYTKRKENGKIRLSLSGASIVKLYKKAFNEKGKYNFEPANTIILNVQDTFKYNYPKNKNLRDEWDGKYCYSYDLVLPESKKDQVYEIMRQDLVRFFNATAKIESRMIKCFVLIRTSTKNKLQTKGGTFIDSLLTFSARIPVSSPVRYLQNTPFETLFERLSGWYEYYLSGLLVDETGYKGNIDIQLSGHSVDSFDLQNLKKELKKYDLDIVEKILPQNVLVISEKGSKAD